jgi:hypothetical protein
MKRKRAAGLDGQENTRNLRILWKKPGKQIKIKNMSRLKETKISIKK